jgi:hypothetical protein
MKQVDQFLQEINACDIAREWAQGKTIEEVVIECHRGDWLLWLAYKIKADKRSLTLAKGKCAETVIGLMKDDRSRAAVKAAIDYGNGLISDDELKAAADAAYAAYAADSAYAAYAAAYAAADSAADAAAYAAADAAAYAADSAARKNSQMQTADICREIIGNQIIQIVKSKLL